MVLELNRCVYVIPRLFTERRRQTNRFGGREYSEAIDFIKRRTVCELSDVQTIAEEFYSFPKF
jgi:hypothetical protein